MERRRVIATQPISAEVPEAAALRRVLSVGSGPRDQATSEFIERFEREGYKVVCLDIEPSTQPDILASMCDMGDIGSYEVVYCCHALEHLYPHEVSRALKEFHRVLSPGGTAMIMVPDLEDVRPTEDLLDMPNCGPITGLHLYYGDAAQIEKYPHMAHHCGFVETTLAKAMRAAGFAEVSVRRAAQYNLIGTGRK